MGGSVGQRAGIFIIVDTLEFLRGLVTQRGMQTFTVVPVDPVEDDLDERTAAERRTLGDGFVHGQAHHRFGGRVVVRIPDAADGRNESLKFQGVGAPDRSVLTASITVKPNSA